LFYYTLAIRDAVLVGEYSTSCDTNSKSITRRNYSSTALAQFRSRISTNCIK